MAILPREHDEAKARQLVAYVERGEWHRLVLAIPRRARRRSVPSSLRCDAEVIARALELVKERSS